jgi:REP element-mobilizing transposase RayT
MFSLWEQPCEHFELREAAPTTVIHMFSLWEQPCEHFELREAAPTTVIHMFSVGAASAAMPASAFPTLISPKSCYRSACRASMLCDMAAPGYPSAGSARLRLGRSSETGRIYLVTFATASRHAVFAEWETAQVAAKTLCNPLLWRDSRLLCWVLMPDHWHGLIELGSQDSLSAIVRRLKGVCARAVNLACVGSGPLWMSGFHDHALRHDEELVDVARYVVLNPVRAGLVTRAGLYPFWDSIWLRDEKHRG